MKYIDADKLIAEIERRRLSNRYIDTEDYENELLEIINSLQQEQPEVDLEKEIEACWQNWLSPSNQKEVEGVLPKTEFAFYAHHFWNKGYNARKSIWHNVAEEIPTKIGSEVIVACRNKNKEDGIWLYDLIQCWEGEWQPRVNWETPVKWAYVRDLDNASKED